VRLETNTMPSMGRHTCLINPQLLIANLPSSLPSPHGGILAFSVRNFVAFIRRERRWSPAQFGSRPSRTKSPGLISSHQVRVRRRSNIILRRGFIRTDYHLPPRQARAVPAGSTGDFVSKRSQAPLRHVFEQNGPTPTGRTGESGVRLLRLFAPARHKHIGIVSVQQESRFGFCRGEW